MVRCLAFRRWDFLVKPRGDVWGEAEWSMLRLSRGVVEVLSGGEARQMKKTYEKPAVIHTEEIEARAVQCAKTDNTSCAGRPITS